MRSSIKVLFIFTFLFVSVWMGGGYIFGEKPTQEKEKSKPKIIWLESLCFNHNFKSNAQIKCGCTPPTFTDAIDIRMNYDDPVEVPEWLRESKSPKKDPRQNPAAYIMNSQVVIIAEIYAEKGIISATIGAKKKGNEGLSDITERTVTFPKEVSDECNTSGKIYFCLDCRIPNKVVRFTQVWEWYYKDVKRSNSSAKDKPDTFAKTKNQIYIIFSKPGVPWYETPNTAPWVDVMKKSYNWLETSCEWKKGKRDSPEVAAKAITEYLYEKMRGCWNPGPLYTRSRTVRFDLGKFMEAMPVIGAVNCYDMSKALVTFGNVVGCRLNYKESVGFCKDNLHRLAPFGRGERNVTDFTGHAVVGLDEKIYDPTIKRCYWPKECEFLTFPKIKNWEDYIKEVIQEGTIECPKSYNFPIGSLKIQKIEGSVKQRFDTLWKKYNFNNKYSRTEKVISGLMIPDQIISQFPNMKQIWGKNIYSIEEVEGNIYPIIRHCWESVFDQLSIKMVVGPGLQEIKKYLILNYATWTGESLSINQRDDIGDICFDIEEIKDNLPIRVDFIRNNILIILRAKGNIREKLVKIARSLDNILAKKNTVDDTEYPDFHLSIEKEKINLGEAVPIHLKLEENDESGLNYFWEVSDGELNKKCSKTWTYTGVRGGNHTITVTAVNKVGLHQRNTVQIEVKELQQQITIKNTFEKNRIILVQEVLSNGKIRKSSYLKPRAPYKFTIDEKGSVRVFPNYTPEEDVWPLYRVKYPKEFKYNNHIILHVPPGIKLPAKDEDDDSRGRRKRVDFPQVHSSEPIPSIPPTWWLEIKYSYDWSPLDTTTIADTNVEVGEDDQ